MNRLPPGIILVAYGTSGGVCRKERSRHQLGTVPFTMFQGNAVALALILLYVVGTYAKTKYRVQLYGINYSARQGPDWAPVFEKCKTEKQITKELGTLQSITSRVRIYSLMDCEQGRLVLAAAKKTKMKLWLGIWVSDNPQVLQDEKAYLKQMIQDKLIDDDVVIGIHVGSEAIYRKEVEAKEALEGMDEIKSLLSTNNINIPVTVADISDTYIAYPALTHNVDVASVNNFPFWEAHDVETSVAHLIKRVKPVSDLAEKLGKPFLISETGWSDAGKNENASEASPDNLKTYFQSFYCGIHVGKPMWQYYYFTGFDEPWRVVQEGEEDTVEGHFGLFTSDQKLKPQFKKLEFTCAENDDTIYSMYDGKIQPQLTTDTIERDDIGDTSQIPSTTESSTSTAFPSSLLAGVLFLLSLRVLN